MANQESITNIFKPEDFPNLLGLREQAAEDANEKLNKLIESWPVVYGKGSQWDQTDGKPDSYVDCTHHARLAFIEEIKKEPCNHEASEVEISNTIFQGPFDPKLGCFRYEKSEWKIRVFTNRCRHCGVELQAAWTPKN